MKKSCSIFKKAGWLVCGLLFISFSSLFAEEKKKELPTLAEAHFWNQTHQLPVREVPMREIVFDSEASISACHALNQCKLAIVNGALTVHSEGSDPYFMMQTPLYTAETWEDGQPKQVRVRLTLRGEPNYSVGIYWVDSKVPNFSEERNGSGLSQPDLTEWKTVDVDITAPYPIRQWRVDPGMKKGRIEIKKIEFLELKVDGPQVETLPMESVLRPGLPVSPKSTADTLAQLARTPNSGWRSEAFTGSFPREPQTVRIRVMNPENKPAVFRVNGKEEAFSPKSSRIFSFVSDPKQAVQKCVWKIEVPGFTPFVREMTLIHDAELTPDWKKVKGKDFDLRISPDGQTAFLCRNGKKIAAILGLNSETMPFSVVENTIEFRVSGPCVLPTVRLPGEMTYAALPGLELLENGEWSSSMADIMIPEHDRIRPAPELLTQTWAGVVTQDGAFRLHWANPAFQPVFAVPNYFDTTPDAMFRVEVGENMVLNGTETVRLEFSPSVNETEFLHAALKDQLAHTKSVAVRDPSMMKEEELGGAREKLFALYRQQLESGPIRSEAGWGHCAGEKWHKGPAGDIASAFWRIGGEVPDMDFHPGGAHIGNDTIFFIRGRAQKWYSWCVGGAEGVLRGRGADGSWRYAGEYDVTHFESTALGRCAQPCWVLLRGYVLSGEKKYLDAALGSIAWCRRFHVARGGQCWEMPLHTPDPLAAGQMVRACALAYRITKDPQYLADAERWALEGATYVYLWDTEKSPWQFGAYIGVIGATNWKAPNWIGRPVQWIGTVYAYALLDYAEALTETEPERAKLWRQMAEWITLSAERQIYQDGEFVGLLPDSVLCQSGIRYPWNINPAVPIALRLRLDGDQDAVQMLWNEKFRIASPYPSKLEGDTLCIQAPSGAAFQIIVNGKAKDVRASAAGETVVLLTAEN